MKELSKQDIEVVLAGKGLPGELLAGESLAKYFARLYLATKDSRDEQLAQRDAQIAALTAGSNALRAEGVESYCSSVLSENSRIASEYGNPNAAKTFDHLHAEAMDYANQLRKGK